MQKIFIFSRRSIPRRQSGSHKLTAIRGGEIDVYEMKGVKIVIANGKGVSVFTLEGLKNEGLAGYAWLFKKGTNVEMGLKLIDDEKPEHYTLAPTRNMPLDEYKGLLEKMGIKCSKYLKIKKDGSMERTA